MPNIVVTKKEPIQVLNELVSLEELSFELVNPFHIEMIIDHVKNAIQYEGTPVKLHLYRVLPDEKGRPYYSDLTDLEKQTSYSNDKLVFVIVDEYVGIMETNSNKLFLDVLETQGVTQQDIDTNSLYYQEYMAHVKSSR